MIVLLANLAALLVMPLLMGGLILRVKSLWAGRKGPPLLQPFFDVVRLVRKTPVYSVTTTPLFRIAPWVFLATAVAAAVVAPLLGGPPIAAFPFDFVWLAYAWGLGRVAIMLAALDTGSAFEGMGASREATFSTLVEPALFLVVGALLLQSGASTLHQALAQHFDGGGANAVRVCAVVTLLVVLQVEAARMPVDDPATHLELTMVHEAMVLDHGGADLAAIQVGSALKLFVVSAAVATLLNPWAGAASPLAAAANLVICVLVAVGVGTVESLVARLQLRAVPKYVVVALVSAATALLATSWRGGGGA